MAGEVIAGKGDGLVEMKRVLGGDEKEIVVGSGVRDGVAAGMHVGISGFVFLAISGRKRNYVAFSVRLFEIIWRSERAQLVEEYRLRIIQIRELPIREDDFLHVIVYSF